MNLIIDIGNSNAKLALYSEGRKAGGARFQDLSPEMLEKFISTESIEKAILSSTGGIPEFIKEFDKSRIPFLHVLSHKSEFPFKIEYQTPESLGTDRLAGVAGAIKYFPGFEILVIDAGTAITFDFISDNIYKGGNISPGISMRFKALNTFTQRLPLVSESNEFQSPGRNTHEAIGAGVITGVIYEINEYIRTFKKKHSGFKIILTGGDGEFITKRIEHHVTFLPDIVSDGLNYILEYNAQKRV